MRKIFVLLLTALLCAAVHDAAAKKKEKKEEKKENRGEKKVDTLTRYDKLFRNKPRRTASGGSVTIHETGGKIYFEIPLHNLGRGMLLSSAVLSSSNGGISPPGARFADPVHICFGVEDSLVLMKRIGSGFLFPDSTMRAQRLRDRDFSAPDIYKYAIKAYNNDSTAVVFDVSDLLLGAPGRDLPVSPPPDKDSVRVVTASFDRKLAKAMEIYSCGDNASVVTRFAGKYNLREKARPPVDNVPFTVTAGRTLAMLPQDKMTPRISDRRIGTLLVEKREVSGREDRFPKVSYACRWRLEPADSAAYVRGEPTRAARPIVFYVDTLFPKKWGDAVRDGVLKWNRAFEAIGLRDVLQAADLSAGSAGNGDPYRFTIRYVPQGDSGASANCWIDPATGEISGATITVCGDVANKIAAWRYVQTAQVDASVRTGRLPEDLLMESLAIMATHETGHCLGLLHNMGASAAYPVDSLRSASFTARRGITPSVMDYARFNYVAQPGDEGVTLTPPDLGDYDMLAIRWLYTPYLSCEEARKMLSETSGRRFFYGRQQTQAVYDPASLEEDLGDDAIRAGDYGVANLQYILSNMERWIAGGGGGGERLRGMLYEEIARQYDRYIDAVMANVGGIYLFNEGERFSPLPRELQRSSARWVIGQAASCGWLDNAEVMAGLPVMIPPSAGTAAGICGKINEACGRIVLSASHSSDPYTLEDYMDDIYQGIWAGYAGRRPVPETIRVIQRRMPGMLSEQTMKAGANKLGYYSTGAGYGWQPKVDVSSMDDVPDHYYNLILRIRDLLLRTRPDWAPQDRLHYESVLFSLEGALGKDKKR